MDMMPKICVCLDHAAAPALQGEDAAAALTREEEFQSEIDRLEEIGECISSELSTARRAGDMGTTRRLMKESQQNWGTTKKVDENGNGYLEDGVMARELKMAKAGKEEQRKARLGLTESGVIRHENNLMQSLNPHCLKIQEIREDCRQNRGVSAEKTEKILEEILRCRHEKSQTGTTTTVNRPWNEETGKVMTMQEIMCAMWEALKDSRGAAAHFT